MCIAAWVWQAHPRYPLLLLSNRDEYHERPTRPVEWWGDGDQKILGGRDEIAGGTWLGCTRSGRLALLTNFREPDPSPSAKSRGDLTLRFLQGYMGPLEFADEVAKEVTKYNGFNLVLADLCSKVMVYVSNRPLGEPALVQIVSPGLHVLSNANLDAPWPKAQRLHKNFKELIRSYGDEEILGKEMVLKLMSDSVKTDPDRLPNTGCPPEWEFNLSSIFVEVESKKVNSSNELSNKGQFADLPVVTPVQHFMRPKISYNIWAREWHPMGWYGTRSMAALSVIENGEVSFFERYLDSGDGIWKEHTVEYQMGNIQAKKAQNLYQK